MMTVTVDYKYSAGRITEKKNSFFNLIVFIWTSQSNLKLQKGYKYELHFFFCRFLCLTKKNKIREMTSVAESLPKMEYVRLGNTGMKVCGLSKVNEV